MECVVYHWWSEEYDKPLAENLRTPILQSIASLRGADETIPIYILDGSTSPQNWHYWSKSLRFKVIPIQFTYAEKYAHCAGYKNLSRIADIWKVCQQLAEEKIIYCDADVFWIRSPRPTIKSGQKFSFNKYNSGFFYYDQNSPDVKQFHDVFLSYITTALNDENFRIISRQYTDYREWYFVLDETVLTYMAYKLPELFDLVDTNEHCTASMSALKMPNPDLIRMYHTHGVLIKNVLTGDDHARGLTPLLIKECWDTLKKVGEEKINMLYPASLLVKYLPAQRSLFDPTLHQSLMQSKNDKGLCRLTQALGIS